MKTKIIAIATICISLASFTTTFAAGTADFVTVWETKTANDTITIPTNSNYTYNYTVDCGGGTLTAPNPQTGNAICTYPTVADNHEIRISGTFPAIHFNFAGDRLKIKDIKQWGTGQWKTLDFAFWGTSNMTVSATDTPNLSETNLSMQSMFYNASVANPDVSRWDTSSVTSISSMFQNAVTANPDPSGWNVSSLTNGTSAFDNSAFSADNYDKLLQSWSQQSLQRGVPLGADSAKYCNTAARTALMGAPYRWTFTDAGPEMESECPTNTAPTVTGLPKNIDVIADTNTGLDLSAAVFTDAEDDILTLTMSAITGTFTATGNDDITISGSTTGTLGISGTPADLHTYLDNTAAVQYTTSGSDTISATLRDARTALAIHTITALIPTADFVTLWETKTVGETITIPTRNNLFTYDYNVDCGDGTLHATTPNPQTGNAICTYPTVADDHEIRISGIFPHIYLLGSADAGKIKDITQWGTGQWQSFFSAFNGASNMEVNATDVPNLSAANISMGSMFYNARAANPDVSRWDTSNVTNMDSMFRQASMADPDVSKWDVRKVVDLENMFASAIVADPDVSGWQTDSLIDMENMFSGASAANPDVSGWNILSVTSAVDMFNNSALSTTNYDKLLRSWSRQSLQSGVRLGANNTKHCNTTARAILTEAPNNWIITDAGVGTESECANLDIDGNELVRASTDGILIARYIASVRGESLIAGAVAGNASEDRNTADEIEAYLDILIPADSSADKPLDIDGNGTVQAATDGILIARFIASVSGESLIAGAVAAGGTRKTAGEIEAYLESLDI